MALNNGMNISPIQIRRVDAKAIGSDTQTIDQLFHREPEKMETIIAGAVNNKLISQGLANPLDYLTSGLNNIEYIDGQEFRWDIIASQDDTFPISRAPLSPTQLGQGGSTFDLFFSQQAFVKGQTLFSPKGQQVILVDSMYPEGGHWVAKVRLKDSTQFAIDSSEIQLNSRWYGSYKTVGERTDSDGRDISFSGNSKLQTRTTTIRLSHFVTGEAARSKFMIDIINPNNAKQKVSAWGDWAMLLFQRQIRMDISDMLYKSIPTTYMDANGYPIVEGAGLEYQLSGGNKHYYNGTLEFRKLQMILESLLTDYSAQGEGTTFTLVTGRGGISVITDMIERKQSSQAFQVIDSSYFFTNLEGNLKEYKDPQFKSIKFMNGITLNIVLNPVQDSKKYQHWMHPKSGYSVESYKMLIFRDKASDGKSNIRQVIRRSKENIMTFQSGLVSPFSLGGNDRTFRETTSGRDGYNIDYVTERGIKVADPTGVAMLVLNM